MLFDFPAELLTQVSQLPMLPGVYRFFDADEQLLYVGKAIALKKRVTSYFQRDHAGTRIGHMVSKITRLEVTVVQNETEALLLENNLIKRQHPKYNILFRDDKSYPYLRMDHFYQKMSKKTSLANQFSRISYFRGAIDRSHRYFGPYPSAAAVKSSILLLQKVFRLRTCEDAVFNHRSRPCLLYQIKRCSAPCVGYIALADYAQEINKACEFLEGKSDQLLQNLQSSMLTYSEQMNFEKAAEIRDQIQSLSHVLQQQTMESVSDGDVDIVAVALQGDRACVNVAMVRGGLHLGDRAYFPSQVANAFLDKEQTNELPEEKEQLSLDSQVLTAFVAQHYLQVPLPRVLIVSHAIDEQTLSLLFQTLGKKVTLVTHPQLHRKTWLDMAKGNAERQLKSHLDAHGKAADKTRALMEVLDLTSEEYSQLRVECFDISHTQGEATQASCVVYEHHYMQPKQFRRFNVEGITAGDDYAAMRQVLMRRYEPIGKALASPDADIAQQPAKKLPDVVLIDGGKGQISSAKAVFEELGLSISLLVGVEKGTGRKVGLEELVFADGRAKLSLNPDSPALLLVAQIRDEAHRFAITGMRAKRDKARVGGGRLEDIAGVGPKRRASLLQRFGGVRGVAQASIVELASVNGISMDLAALIYQGLH